MPSLISHHNFADDTGTIIASDSVLDEAGVGLDNLTTEKLVEIYRSGNVATRTLSITLPESKEVAVVALAAPKDQQLPESTATIEIKASNLALGQAEVYKSGKINGRMGRGLWAIPLGCNAKSNYVWNSNLVHGIAGWAAGAWDGSAVVPSTIASAKSANRLNRWGSGEAKYLGPMPSTGYLNAIFEKTSLLDMDSAAARLAPIDPSWVPADGVSRAHTPANASATYYNSAGVLTEAAQNTPRVDYNPLALQARELLLEPARTERFENPRLEGGAAGTPGTYPTGVALTSSAAGITHQIVSIIAADANTKILRIRVSGTPSAGTYSLFAFAAATLTGLGAHTRLVQAISARSVSGSTTNVTTKLWGPIYNNSAVLVSDPQPTVTLTSSMQRFSRVDAIPATGAASYNSLNSGFLLNYAAGAVDLTFDLWLPSYQTGEHVTTPILPPLGSPQLATRGTESWNGVTFSRTQSGFTTRFNSDGIMEELFVNAPRIAYDRVTKARLGLIMEPARTNRAPNPRVTGGTPGVLGAGATNPTGGNITNTFSGITVTYQNATTVDGVPGATFQIVGTATASGTLTFREVASNVIAVTAGQKWASSMYYKLVAGAWTGFGNTFHRTLTTGGTVVDDQASITPSSTMARIERVLTAGTGNTFIYHQFQVTVSNGQTVNATIFVGGLQIEQGEFCTSLILPPYGTTGASVRGADAWGITLFGGLSAGAALVEQRLDAATATAMAVNDTYFSDGSANNLISLRTVGGATPYVDVVATGNSASIADTLAANATLAAAERHLMVFRQNLIRHYKAGSLVDQDTAGTFAPMSFFNGNQGDAITYLREVRVYAEPTEVQIANLLATGFANLAGAVEAQARLLAQKCTGSIRLNWLDGAGAVIGVSVGESVPASLLSGRRLENYGLVRASALPPAGAVAVQVSLLGTTTTTVQDPALVFAQVGLFAEAGLEWGEVYAIGAGELPEALTARYITITHNAQPYTQYGRLWIGEGLVTKFSRAPGGEDLVSDTSSGDRVQVSGIRNTGKGARFRTKNFQIDTLLEEEKLAIEDIGLLVGHDTQVLVSESLEHLTEQAILGLIKSAGLEPTEFNTWSLALSIEED